MTSNRQAAHVTAPQITLYRPERVNFARHRKPNRRGIGWHLDNLAATLVADAFEWSRRPRKPV